MTQSPQTFARVARLVSMGGTLDVPGNTSATSEFNFFADPYAAQHILDESQGRPKWFDFVLVPLDISSQHTIPFDRLIPNTTANESPLRQFLSALLSRPRKVLTALGLPDAFEMHDPLAAWYLIRTSAADPEPGWGTVKRQFVVEKVGEYTKGMCVVDRRCVVSISKGGLETTSDRGTGLRRGTTEEVATTRAVEGIVVKEGDAAERESEGVDVLLRWPDRSIFVEEMMKRVFASR